MTTGYDPEPRWWLILVIAVCIALGAIALHLAKYPPPLNAPSDAGLCNREVFSFLEITLLSSLGSTPSACEFQCFQVIHGQFNRLLASARRPAIAFNAADKTLAVI